MSDHDKRDERAFLYLMLAALMVLVGVLAAGAAMGGCAHGPEPAVTLSERRSEDFTLNWFSDGPDKVLTVRNRLAARQRVHLRCQVDHVGEVWERFYVDVPGGSADHPGELTFFVQLMNKFMVGNACDLDGPPEALP